MPHEAVELNERAGVEQLLETFAGEQLSALTLARDVLLAARVQRLLAELLELAKLRLGRVVRLRHRPSLNGQRGDWRQPLTLTVARTVKTSGRVTVER